MTDATRPTDPAPPMSDSERIDTLTSQVDSLMAMAGGILGKQSRLESLMREVHAETSGLTMAFHDVNKHLSGIRADAYLASEQMRPMGTRLGELELRIQHVEQSLRDGRHSDDVQEEEIVP